MVWSTVDVTLLVSCYGESEESGYEKDVFFVVLLLGNC